MKEFRTKRELLNHYFHLLENFSSDANEYAKVFHPDVKQTEYPNLVAKFGQERNFQECLKAGEMSRQVLAKQSLKVINELELGHQLVMEAVWTGTLATDFGHLKKGQNVKAFLCMWFEFKDDLILRQRNYDCYEPFDS